jgi:hypothetical protein
MTTLLHPPPDVHSNPVQPGPALRAVGTALNYHSVGLTEAAEYRAEHGTTAGCESIDLEDVDALDAACEADASFDPDDLPGVRDARAWWAEHADGWDAATVPGEPLLPFPDWIECQAGWFRSLSSNAGDWLAAELQQLADLARSLWADTPERLVDRRDAMDRERRDRG